MAGARQLELDAADGGAAAAPAAAFAAACRVALIVAALGPVIAVSFVAVALIFSSVEQGIKFEAERGLQVARGLFLAAGAGGGGGRGGAGRRSRAAGAPARASDRTESARGSARFPAATPSALFEITDATGRIVARCSRGACDELLTGAGRAGLEPAARSPVILRALDYERTVSIESARDRLVVRAALPLTDPALRLLGAVVVTVPIDWTVVDRLKAALGAGREVVVYVGRDPNSSTFMAATGARLVGPTLPHGFHVAGAGGRHLGRAAGGRRARVLGGLRPAAGRERGVASACSAWPSIASRWRSRAGRAIDHAGLGRAGDASAGDPAVQPARRGG